MEPHIDVITLAVSDLQWEIIWSPRLARSGA